MRSFSISLTAVVATLLLITTGHVYGRSREGWVLPLLTAWSHRDDILYKFYCGISGTRTDEEILECYDGKLSVIMSQLEKFLITSDPSRPITESKLFSSLVEKIQHFDYERIFNVLHSPTLDQAYTDTLRHLTSEFVVYLGQARPYGGYVLPLARTCQEIDNYQIPDAKVTQVCPSVEECVQSPYSSTDNGCSQDNKCDVKKALPLMLGVFFYRVSFAFVTKFCSSVKPDHDKIMKQTFDDLDEEVKTMKAFILMNKDKPFDTVYREAIHDTIFSDITSAFQFMADNEEFFSTAPLACLKIKAEDACGTTAAYQQYLILKGLLKKRQERGNRRDLRLFRDIDNQAFIEFMHGTLDKLEILASIDSVDENLMTQSQGLKEYFKGIADYDQKIAEADVAFIKAKLDEFWSEYVDMTTKMDEDLQYIMRTSRITLLVTLGEEIAKLVFMIAENGNPIKVLSSGMDSADMLGQAGAIAKTAGAVAKSWAMFVAMEDLVEDTVEFGNLLYNNQLQISAMQSIVEKIRNNRVEQIEEDAELFLKQYSDYTPQLDINDLERNLQKWSSFQEATCNLLDGTESISGGVTDAVVGGQLLCEKLEGLIGELGALRENMFDFQFDLVDSLALVIRGNLAKKSAENIGSGQVDTLRADKLFTGYLMAQNRIQQHAWLFCDKLMYKNHGRSNEVCSPEGNLFTFNDLADIVAYDENVHYTTFDRTVYIPSKPLFKGDSGYINIPTLVKNKQVSFRIPQKGRWLKRNNWDDKQKASSPLYVKSFHLFLPNKEYTADVERLEKTYSLRIQADPGSFVSARSDVYYQLPEAHLTFNTEYVEGYTSCSKEIDNPYNLCKNLPQVCLTSERDSSRNAENLMPTAFSRFTVTLNIKSGHKSLDWADPKSLTPLRFVAKIKFAKPSTSPEDETDADAVAASDAKPGNNASREERRNRRRRRRRRRRRQRKPKVESQCCEGNKYRKTWKNNKCKKCPKKSKSVMGGYYCELKEESEGGNDK